MGGMRLLTGDEAELAFDAQGMGVPLVFMHGVGSDRPTWRPQAFNAEVCRFLGTTVEASNG